MCRADRAYGQLLVVSAAVGIVLAVPLAITLFPGVLQRALHGAGDLVLTCAATVYSLGAQLPPLGLVVLGLTAATLALGASRSLGMLRRTGRMLSRHRLVRAPGRLRRSAAVVGIADRVLCFSDARPLAYCAGLLGPRVWVSTGAARRLRRGELEAVLWHEAHHVRRRDPLRLLVARVLASALFAVPLVRILAERFEFTAELDADRAAVAAQGSVSQLAGALYKLGGGGRFGVRELAVGAWSLSHARVEHLCGAAPDRLVPRPSGVTRSASAATLAIALLLALGQSARANLLPAGMLSVLGSVDLVSEVHACPLPTDGVLL